ncbi:sensor histidine kinase [Gulosibacter bifidus]|uniref:Sensor histidine kinase n=1 Tax=Gulosibacter bifidus TaxID=272239 RepID=A0ABW5RIS4_9MICO|nr:histidine kinase [Gulosibacter bifidus]
MQNPDTTAGDAGVANPFEQRWFTAIWLVFLAIPILLVASYSTAGMAWDIAAYAATAVFAVTYVAGAERLGHRAPWPQLLTWAGALVAISLVTIPSLEIRVVSYSPYVLAIGLWSSPMRRAKIWAAIVVAVSMLVVVVPLGPADGFQQMLSMSGVYIALLLMILSRLISERSIAFENMQRELATVQERDEISRDIHDLLGHSLTAISLKAQLASRLVDADPARAKQELDELLQLTGASLDEVRGTVGRLRTPDLSSQVQSVRTMLETAEIDYEIIGRADAVPVERRALMAWALREGVTNLVRHSGASTAQICIAPDHLKIVDNGVGVRGGEGHGLTGLRRRVEDAGASLMLRTRDTTDGAKHGASGTVLEVRFA